MAEVPFPAQKAWSSPPGHNYAHRRSRWQVCLSRAWCPAARLGMSSPVGKSSPPPSARSSPVPPARTHSSPRATSASPERLQPPRPLGRAPPRLVPGAQPGPGCRTSPLGSAFLGVAKVAEHPAALAAATALDATPAQVGPGLTPGPRPTYVLVIPGTPSLARLADNIATLAGHVAGFAKILTGRHGGQLGTWITAVDARPDLQGHRRGERGTRGAAELAAGPHLPRCRRDLAAGSARLGPPPARRR